MNMKKIAGVVAGAAFALGLSAPASAVVLSAGDLKITINAYDSGTTGYTGVGTVCTTAATCDTKGTNKAPGAIGNEDTWGIFSVQSITRGSTGATLFTAGQNGEFLTGVFGGIVDTYVENSGGMLNRDTDAAGTGGWLNLYLNSQNYNASYGPTGRLGATGYKGITNIGGTLALSAVFGAGVLEGLPQYTYSSSFNTRTLVGNGEGYLDVTGGSWQSVFDTNSRTDPNGGKHDLFLKTTFEPSDISRASGWTVDTTGDVQGKLGEGEVPEPASLALFGLGLAGLAALRRRRA